MDSANNSARLNITSSVNAGALLISVTSLISLGLISGFFYTYLCSVIFGLNAITPLAAIEAMQGINNTIRNPYFAVIFFGTALLLPIAALTQWLAQNKRATIWLFVAAFIYVAGAIVPTFTINVPMNDALGFLQLSDITSPQETWTNYSDRWYIWNAVRTVFSTLALAIGLMAVTSTSHVSKK